MQRFEDDDGSSWEVVVGRESWGAFYAIFVPRGGDGRRTRQVALDAEDGTEAGRMLDEMSDDALRDLLEASEPKELG